MINPIVDIKICSFEVIYKNTVNLDIFAVSELFVVALNRKNWKRDNFLPSA